MHQASTSFAMRLRAALVCGLIVPAGLAMAQQPTRPPAPAATPDPALDAAQKVFDALPEAERKAIQDDLIWGSDFTATISGSFGPRTYHAIVRFQKAAKLKPDGILDAAGRKLLASAATKARNGSKFSVLVDPKTGAAIGVPTGALSKRDVTPTGSRWTTANKEVVLETAVAAGGAAELPAAFERVVSLNAPDRKVTYKLLRPDFFVVAGQTGTRNFYTRYGVGPTSLRGYTISYPASQQKALERYVIAIANSFNAAPGAPAAMAAQGGAPAPVAGSQPIAPEVWPAGVYQTGLIVAPGKIVTAVHAGICPSIVINRKPARIVATDRNAGLVVLEGDTGATRLAPLMAAQPGDPDASQIVLGFAHAATPVFSVWSATLSGAAPALRITAPLPREAGGSLVFDRRGGLIGLVAAPDGKPRMVAGLVPAISHRLVTAEHIVQAGGTSLATAAPGPALTAGALAATLRPAIVAVECAAPMPRG